MDGTKFIDKVRSVTKEPLTAKGIRVLQVNLGYRCNMACTHCHVSASPSRTESMPKEIVGEVLRVFKDNAIETVSGRRCVAGGRLLKKERIRDKLLFSPIKG